MPGIADFFNDKERVSKLSSFLLGLGQGITAGNERGLSPFGSIALGFGGGGQALDQYEKDKLQKEIIKSKLSEIEREKAARAAFSQLLGGQTPEATVAQQQTTQQFGVGQSLGTEQPSGIQAQNPLTQNASPQDQTPFRDRPVQRQRQDLVSLMIANPDTIPLASELSRILPPEEDVKQYSLNHNGETRDMVLTPRQALALQAQGFEISTPRGPQKRETIVNIQSADGTIRGFRKDDPALDVALKAGGRQIGLSVQATSVEGLLPSATVADNIREDLNAISSARSTIDGIIKGIQANPSRGGALGTVSRLFQKGTGIIGDFVQADAAIKFTNDISSRVLHDIASEQADKAISGFFDPALSQNTVFENSLAYALARALKGSGKLNKDDVESARKSVSITGLFSVREVLSQLQAVDGLLATSEGGLQQRIKGITGNKKESLPQFEVKDGRLVPVE